jgi:hypothetical protein
MAERPPKTPETPPEHPDAPAPDTAFTDDEEAEVRKRLEDLGYVE